MKQLEVLFPGQGANETSHDTTSIDSGGSSSNPTDAFEVADTVWVSDINEYTSRCKDIACSIQVGTHVHVQ